MPNVLALGVLQATNTEPSNHELYDGITSVDELHATAYTLDSLHCISGNLPYTHTYVYMSSYTRTVHTYACVLTYVSEIWYCTDLHGYECYSLY